MKYDFFSSFKYEIWSHDGYKNLLCAYYSFFHFYNSVYMLIDSDRFFFILCAADRRLVLLCGR
jgi:hypothetical protein